MNPFEDAYQRKCQELRQAEIIIESLKYDVERAKTDRVGLQSRLYALEKTLHVSMSGVFTAHDRPILTFVTTMRRGDDVWSVATQIDEMEIMAARDPKMIIGQELQQHLRKMQNEYINRR
jgi:hypothetical protein